jgi:hypothetical protein
MEKYPDELVERYWAQVYGSGGPDAVGTDRIGSR